MCIRDRAGVSRRASCAPLRPTDGQPRLVGRESVALDQRGVRAPPAPGKWLHVQPGSAGGCVARASCAPVCPAGGQPRVVGLGPCPP
eukprot:1073573-Alexandrium_andersonii.AAC.1